MRGAANLLALCLLALTSLSARCQHDENDQAKPQCHYTPQILVDTVSNDCRFYDSHSYGPNKLSIPYGTEVQVTCRGENLTFSRNGNIIEDIESYSSIKFKEKLDLQSSQYIFKCTHFETTCEQLVNILVTQRIEVISPNVKTCLHYQHCSQATYYVQYGNSVSVLCSGADATRLVMKKDGNTLPTERKNGTTIESFEMKPNLQLSEYSCSDIDTTLSTSVNIDVLPNIYFQSQNETITPYYIDIHCYGFRSFLPRYYFQYSGSIAIFCSGPRTVKFIDTGHYENNTILSTEYYNQTTIFTNITKSGISKTFKCTDSEFSDYVQRAIVLVFNRMEVVSPSVHPVGIEHGVPHYTILYGQPLEIVCSGSDTSRLSISDSWHGGGTDITNSVVQAVNKSAIKYIRNNPVWSDFHTFICSNPERYGHDVQQSRIGVAVLPTVTNFRCVAYTLMQFVNCTWTGVSNTVNNTLYYVAYGILTRICQTPPTSRLRSKFCVWEYQNDKRYMGDKVLTFLIQSCGFVACYNQTFQFDHLSIVKLPPPEGLTVLRTTSRSVVLRWNYRLNPYYGDLDKEVQYLYHGIEPREVNSSLVTCNHHNCKIELNLPCPEQFYEVRISHKVKKASEEFMSAPSFVTFYTDRESDVAINNDPTCTQESIKTKEVMRYFVQELRKEMHPEIQPMKRAVHALQEKLDNIRKYKASLKEQGEK